MFLNRFSPGLRKPNIHNETDKKDIILSGKGKGNFLFIIQKSLFSCLYKLGLLLPEPDFINKQ
jgi:hypothetical protein